MSSFLDDSTVANQWVKLQITRKTNLKFTLFFVCALMYAERSVLHSISSLTFMLFNDTDYNMTRPSNRTSTISPLARRISYYGLPPPRSFCHCFHSLSIYGRISYTSDTLLSHQSNSLLIYVRSLRSGGI
jgi:hypothetical protein